MSSRNHQRNHNSLYPAFTLTATSTTTPRLEPATLSQHRVRTCTAHALLLSAIYGVPLSSGIWLEYYFDSRHPSTSLLALSVIFGAQLACLGLAIGLTAWLYHRWPKSRRLHMFVGVLSVCGAWLGLLITEELWVLVLCQGALTGLGLGMLGTVSMLVLRTHYKNNLAVASSLCGGAGFAGAVVYTGLTWICLRTDAVKLTYGVTLALLSGTFLVAVFLTRPCVPKPPTTSPARKPETRGPRRMTWTTRLGFVSTAVLITPALLFLPLFLPLLLSRPPSQYRADTGPYTLFVLFGAAMLASTLIAKLPSRRLSPTTLLIAAILLAGVATMPIIWTPTLYIALPCAAVLGVGLGGVFTLWLRVLADAIGQEEGAGHDRKGESVGLGETVCAFTAVGGLSAGGGVVGAAAVLERWEGGVNIVLGVAGACLLLGGLLLGTSAGMMHWRRKNNRGNQ